MNNTLRGSRHLLVGVAACCGLAGCGPTQVEVTGKIVTNGQPYKPKSDDDLQIILHPKGANGVTCAAAVKGDGTFKLQGPTGGRVPAGTYRVELAAYTDPFKGAFTGERSPLVYEAKESPAAQTIVVDLGKKTVTGE